MSSIEICVSLIVFQGLAIKVQEQKRDEALSRLVPAAASVICHWWRLRCVHHGDRFVSTWKIYTLMQRRIHTVASPINSTLPAHVNTHQSRSITNTTAKLGHIRRKSITSVNDLPQRYVTVIRVIRILKYALACKKFDRAKQPVDLKDLVKENTQMNNRLSTTLNDIQRRLDSSLGTTKTTSSFIDEHKRPLSLTTRIEHIEQITSRCETQLNYLEDLALKFVENR
jgi:hypothetical protein